MTHKPALGYAMLEALLALALAAAAVGTWHQAQRRALAVQHQQRQQQLAERLLDDWNARFRLLAPAMTTRGWQAVQQGQLGADCQASTCGLVEFAAWWWRDWQTTQHRALPTTRVDVQVSPAAHGGSQRCITLAPPTRGQPPWATRCWYG